MHSGTVPLLFCVYEEHSVVLIKKKQKKTREEENGLQQVVEFGGRVCGARERTHSSTVTQKRVQPGLVSPTQTTTWTAAHKLSGLEF